MNSPTIGLRVAAAVFALVALLPIARLLTHFEVIVGGHVVPFWPNALALVIAAGLAGWMWRLSTLARFGETH
jgi:hypothetical protein